MTFAAATQRTMYFIGVTTGKSSIMKVFPAWSAHLGLDAVMQGIDFAPNSEPADYRGAVDFIKRDPLSLGALVTTHKVNLLKASKDLFEVLDPYAQTLHEISSISKRGTRADRPCEGSDHRWRQPRGDHAGRPLGKDWRCPLHSRVRRLVPRLTLYLHNKKLAGGDVPAHIVVTARREASLAEMRNVHGQIGFNISIDYRLAPASTEADKVVAELPPRSMVVNATGLGKDGPGSP